MGKRKKDKNSPGNKENTKRAAKQEASKQEAVGNTANAKGTSSKSAGKDLNMQNIQNTSTPVNPVNQNQHQFQTHNATFDNGMLRTSFSPPQSQSFTFSPCGPQSYGQTQSYYGPLTQVPNTVSLDHFTKMMERFDHIEKKLSQLDTIQPSVQKITGRLDKQDSRLNAIEKTVEELEKCRNFDGEYSETINRKQKEIDSMFNKLRSLETEQTKVTNNLKTEIIDLKSRSMRDNLIFYGIAEENGEKDEDCARKVLDIIEQKLEIPGARDTMKLQRAH